MKHKISEKIVCFRLTQEDYETLTMLAEKYNTTVSQVVRTLIQKSVEKPIDPGYHPEGLAWISLEQEK